MENRFEQNSEERQDWGAYATPPPLPKTQNSPRNEGPVQTGSPLTLCHRVRDMLPHLIENDGEIRPEMATAVYAHLAVCPGCAREFDEMQRVIDLMENLLPAEMPMDFSNLIMQRVQTEGKPLWDDMPRPILAASSVSGEEAAARVETKTTTATTAQTQTQTAGLGLTQGTETRLRLSALPRLTLAGLLTALFAFFLSNTWGRQMLGTNLEMASNWMEQIGQAVRSIPLLGWVAEYAFRALDEAGRMIQESYRTLGATAARGLAADVALCGITYYVLMARQQRARNAGY